MANKVTKKVFSKAEWLKSANEDLAAGILTQREIDDACEIWVNALDGKTADEIVAECHSATIGLSKSATTEEATHDSDRNCRARN